MKNTLIKIISVVLITALLSQSTSWASGGFESLRPMAYGERARDNINFINALTFVAAITLLFRLSISQAVVVAVATGVVYIGNIIWGYLAVSKGTQKLWNEDFPDLAIKLMRGRKIQAGLFGGFLVMALMETYKGIGYEFADNIMPVMHYLKMGTPVSDFETIARNLYRRVKQGEPYIDINEKDMAKILIWMFFLAPGADKLPRGMHLRALAMLYGKRGAIANEFFKDDKLLYDSIMFLKNEYRPSRMAIMYFIFGCIDSLILVFMLMLRFMPVIMGMLDNISYAPLVGNWQPMVMLFGTIIIFFGANRIEKSREKHMSAGLSHLRENFEKEKIIQRFRREQNEIGRETKANKPRPATIGFTFEPPLSGLSRQPAELLGSI